MKTIVSLAGALALSVASSMPLLAADAAKGDSDVTSVKGEVIDLACYADHGASGAKHAGCAQKCISSGLPVGLKTGDGKLYIVIGDHKPMNKELAPEAGKVVTLKGKIASRDGVNLLENAELVQ